MKFLEFFRETCGFRFFDKKTNKEVYRYQLYWAGYSVHDVFQYFNSYKRN